MANKATQWFRALPAIRKKAAKASLHQAATIKQGQIFILPTRQGLVFGLMLVVMLLAAVNYNNNMSYALCFVLASVSVISLFHSYLNMLGITIKPRLNPACFAGEQAVFTLQLSNPQQRERVQISVETNTGVVATTDIGADHYALLSLTHTALQRGRLKLGPITLHSRYPLGLFRAWSYADIDAETIVYPNPVKTALALSFGHAKGERIDSKEPGSDDFHGLRHYQEGDSPRHIHWRSWAQGREMMSKQFHRKQSSEIWLTWDQTNSQATEARLSQLCHWVLYADGHKHLYGLKIPGTTLQPGQGEQHRHQCLKALALFGQPA